MTRSDFFELRGKLPKETKLIIELSGVALGLIIWFLITWLKILPSSILPSPIDVVKSFGELHFEDAVVREAIKSTLLNLAGLTEAVIFAIPLGMLIGLNPIFRAAFERHITSARFLPLTALVGIFIAWFGIALNMKVQFLAFSIFIYLIAAVIQRVDEIEEVYDQTVITLGGSKWQRIRYVFFPLVMAKAYDDIRVLGALSWTYIVVAEMVNSNGGGVGAMIYIASRQSRVDKVIALVVIIASIGFILDKVFIAGDRFIFKHKYPQILKAGR
jgi:NitT/TauT family transport system permease protein